MPGDARSVLEARLMLIDHAAEVLSICLDAPDAVQARSRICERLGCDEFSAQVILDTQFWALDRKHVADVRDRLDGLAPPAEPD